MTEWPSTVSAWIIFIFSGLFVAVIGNFVWEYLLRAGCAKIGQFVWRGISVGGGRAADSIVRATSYRKDPTASVILNVLTAIIMIAMVVASWYPSRFSPEDVALSESTHKMEREILALSKSKRPDMQSYEKQLIRHEQEQERKDQRDIGDDVDAVSMAGYIALTVFLVYVARAKLIQRIVSTFDRSLASLRPTLSDRQVRDIEAQWANMRTIADFNEVKALLRTLMASAHPAAPSG